MPDTPIDQSDDRLGVSPHTLGAPRRVGHRLQRTKLIQRLGSVDPRTIVAVTAPAGYGKTTTIALWDASDERSFVWIHLTDRDNDPLHLIRHIAIGVHQEIEMPDDGLLASLGEPGTKDLGGLTDRLVGSLSRCGGSAIVLDDTHVLTSEGSTRVLQHFVSSAGTGYQLVVSGRSLPDIGLARLSLYQEAETLGPSELAMDTAEAESLLGLSGLRLDKRDLAQLVDRLEGWPVGVHLAATTLAGYTGDVRAWINAPSQSMLGDFLVDEVLASMPEDMVEFLESSSVLRTMDPDRLDSLLDRDDSARMLARIEAAGNCFLVPLDSRHRLFRYHHLFGELLQQRLQDRSSDRYRQLHGSASMILELEGDLDGAVEHAVAAADLDRAANLVLAHAQQVIFAGELARFERLLGLLGDRSMHESPVAALSWCWFAEANFDTELLKQALASTESLLLAETDPATRRTLEVSLAMVRAMAAWNGNDGVIADTEFVRAAGHPPLNQAWTLATVVQGTAYAMRGDLELARERFDEAAESPGGSHVMASATLAHRAVMATYDGDLKRADRLVSKASQLFAEHRLHNVAHAVLVPAASAYVHALGGNHEEARAALPQAQLMTSRLGNLAPRSILFSSTLAARAALVLGEHEMARDLVKLAHEARLRDSSALLANELLDGVRTQLESADISMTGPLTPAESRVLRLMQTHLSIQEIADQLGVTRNTAKTHCVAIYRKFGASSRSEAVDIARELGVLPVA